MPDKNNKPTDPTALSTTALLLSSLRDVVVWQETFDRGECRRNDLDEAIKDAKALIKKLTT